MMTASLMIHKRFSATTQVDYIKTNQDSLHFPKSPKNCVTLCEANQNGQGRSTRSRFVTTKWCFGKPDNLVTQKLFSVERSGYYERTLILADASG